MNSSTSVFPRSQRDRSTISTPRSDASATRSTPSILRPMPQWLASERESARMARESGAVDVEKMSEVTPSSRAPS